MAHRKMMATHAIFKMRDLRWLGLLAATFLSLNLVAQTPANRRPWPTQQWTTATPESQGMDSRDLAAFVDFGAANGMDSLVVTRHGRVVAEAYFGTFKSTQRHRINSATKGVVAALVGMAIEQGKLPDTSKPLLSYFADRTIANVDERKKAITVQHLLDMTSGLNWTEPLSDAPPVSLGQLRGSADWVQFILDRPMATSPGTTFNYNSGNSHLLAAILTQQTGMGVQDFAMQNLFGPLGISDVAWDKDPQGIQTGGFGLSMRTRDMAKIAYLYLNNGQWDGRQLVPGEWVSKVYQARVPMDWPYLMYGDQWWTVPNRQIYAAVGFNRQLILVLPQSDMAVALTGRTHYSLELMLDVLQRAVRSDQPLPENPTDHALLVRRQREVQSP
jgi:CubicO group peptidase (beta-lactamase class C family)